MFFQSRIFGLSTFAERIHAFLFCFSLKKMDFGLGAAYQICVFHSSRKKKQSVKAFTFLRLCMQSKVPYIQREGTEKNLTYSPFVTISGFYCVSGDK